MLATLLTTEGRATATAVDIDFVATDYTTTTEWIIVVQDQLNHQEVGNLGRKFDLLKSAGINLVDFD